jgi:hypothetical protein
MPNYTPPDENAELYARFKRHNDAAKELLPKVREAAVQDLKADASVGQLAKWTGLTDEVFRRIAREAGVARKKAPTVGHEVMQQAQAANEEDSK